MGEEESFGFIGVSFNVWLLQIALLLFAVQKQKSIAYWYRGCPGCSCILPSPGFKYRHSSLSDYLWLFPNPKSKALGVQDGFPICQTAWHCRE